MKKNKSIRAGLKLVILSILTFLGLGAVGDFLWPNQTLPYSLVMFGLNLFFTYILLVKPLLEKKAKVIPLRKRHGS